jgi:hypothetical protein
MIVLEFGRKIKKRKGGSFSRFRRPKNETARYSGRLVVIHMIAPAPRTGA